MAPWVLSHFGEHRTYTEAFGGAMSVLLQKERSYAEIYNDLDEEVVNLFRVLQDPAKAERLIDMLYLTPFARAEFRKAYRPIKRDPIERARRTVIKAFMGFGSNAIHVDSPQGRGFNTRVSTERSGVRQSTGFRYNANRSGTTPAADWRHYPDAVPAIVERLRGVVIENRDAVEVLERFDRPDALHYVDPPYVHSTRSRARRDRYRYELEDEEHRRLAEVLHGLTGMVVLSGYHSPLFDELYADWTHEERRSRTDGIRHRKSIEVLWLNPSAQRNRQPTLFDGASEL